MYKKLNVDLGEIDFSRIKGNLNNMFGKNFIEYSINDIDYLEEVLSKKISFRVKPDRVNITDILNPGAAPHTDFWPVSLNYYVSYTDSKDITLFYKKTVGQQVREICMYDPKTLSPIGFFKAKQGDCILLNTHIPHSVKMAETNKEPRTILRFTWFDKTFDEILESIKIL
jgi:hypothetical protein